MLIKIYVASHERAEAIKAYRHHLTDDQVTEIEDAPEGRSILLVMGGGPTRVTIEPR